MTSRLPERVTVFSEGAGLRECVSVLVLREMYSVYYSVYSVCVFLCMCCANGQNVLSKGVVCVSMGGVCCSQLGCWSVVCLFAQLRS